MERIVSENIRVTLSGSLILKDVSLVVNKGDWVGIIGPNGSGKSTFLKCLYRTLVPDSGNSWIDGKTICNLPHRETAQKIAVVSQHNELQFDFSVLEMVLMGRTPFKKFMDKDNYEDRDIVREALEKVDMWVFRDRQYGTLSGGEKQRVILARALAQQTDYIILDEPTNHLDIRHQLEFMNLIKTMDKTVLFAVHDLSIALNYCDKIGVLNGGVLVDFGPAREIVTPETISRVFGVHAAVAVDEMGNSHVQYRGISKK